MQVFQDRLGSRPFGTVSCDTQRKALGRHTHVPSAPAERRMVLEL